MEFILMVCPTLVISVPQLNASSLRTAWGKLRRFGVSQAQAT